MPGPLAARVGTETSGNAKFNSGGEEFTCAAVLQVPLPEHLSSPPRQKSQGWVLHAIESDGLGEPSQSALSATVPLSSVTHVQARVLIPPPQWALQGPQSDVDQLAAGAQRAVLHACSEKRGADSRSKGVDLWLEGVVG